MKVSALIVGLLLVASSAFACTSVDQVVEYEKVFSDVSPRGYEAFIAKGSHSGSKVFTVTVKVLNKKSKKTAKNNNQCVLEDYVIDCANASYHVQNSTKYFNYNVIGHTTVGEEEDIKQGTLPEKLKELYCGE
jgi:hypothetical protein